MISDITVEQVLAAGLEPIGPPVPGDIGLSGAGLALQQHGPNVVILDSGGVELPAGAAVSIARLCGRDLCYILVSGVSDTYGFFTISSTPRTVVSQESEVLLDDGEPAPGEPDRWDEDSTLEFFVWLSGVSLNDVIDAASLPVRVR